MLFGEKTAEAKRSGLRKELSSGKLLQMPGAHEPIIARIIEEAGFDGVYISGGAISASLALPDIGLTTLSEVTQKGRQIARVTDLPALIDLDTGFGEAINTARTIQECEELGLSGCHLEDQMSPKRCGHLDHKTLIKTNYMCQKIQAAVNSKRDPNFLIIARTDAKEVEGLKNAVERAKAYVQAGAEAIFPEALSNEKEFELFRNAVDVPLIANMTEFGKTPMYGAETLQNFGYNIAIYPVSSLRLALGAIEKAFKLLKKEGSLQGSMDMMQTRLRLYEVLQYEKYGQFDQNIHNFKL